MAEKEIITIEISIDGKKLIFDKNNYKSPLPFVDTEEDDADGQNIRIELGIAKVFHKVLDFIKTDTDLFQKQDFELLGEMLSKILFGKQGDPRGQSMLDTRKFIVGGLAKSCRIILAFDAKSNVANLPWEYVLYKFQVAEKAYETFYLSASNKSNFQIIRRFPVNIQACKHPKQEKLFVILLLNTEGNTNATPRINGMSTEVASILGMFDSLKKMFPDRIEFAKIEAASMEDVKKKVEDIVMGWKQLNNDLEPAYVLHYVGHAMLEGQIGKLAIKPKEGEPINWVKDKVFASLFNSDMLDVRQPSMVLFLACNSAKMGIIDNTLRGVAYEFTRIGIPAVVGMQNEINTIQSCAFYFKVYESLLNGEDISEAVTKGRDHLGTDNKDFCNQQLQPIGEPYKNNYFGSPVLFITTNEPVIMIKAVENIPAGDTGESGKQVRFSQLDRASKGAEPVSEDPIRDETKAKGLDELQKGGFDVKKNNLSDKNKQ